MRRIYTYAVTHPARGGAGVGWGVLKYPPQDLELSFLKALSKCLLYNIANSLRHGSILYCCSNAGPLEAGGLGRLWPPHNF